MERKKITKKSDGGLYFSLPSNLQRVPSGCTLLDQILGGGWPLGRISNIVGDRSSGKTLLAIEACANFALNFTDPKKNIIRYREVEDAFDVDYASHIGLPKDRVELLEDNVDTVEEFFADYKQFLESVPKDGAGFYVLDSLDALSDSEEMKAEFGANSYGMKKPKLMKQMFRRIVRETGNKNVHLMVISQLYDKIGVMFGEKQGRTGGRALDYFASQIIWLAQIKALKRTQNKVEREYGILVKAKAKKNKVGLPHRDCEFPVIYSFGIDDFEASVSFLEEVGQLDQIGLNAKSVNEFRKKLNGLSNEEYHTEKNRINKVVARVWKEIETKFLPTRRKYG